MPRSLRRKPRIIHGKFRPMTIRRGTVLLLVPLAIAAGVVAAVVGSVHRSPQRRVGDPRAVSSIRPADMQGAGWRGLVARGRREARGRRSARWPFAMPNTPRVGLVGFDRGRAERT